MRTLERVTGTRPVGFNAFWLRGTPQTLEILQDLGFRVKAIRAERDDVPGLVLPAVVGSLRDADETWCCA